MKNQNDSACTVNRDNSSLRMTLIITIYQLYYMPLLTFVDSGKRS